MRTTIGTAAVPALLAALLAAGCSSGQPRATADSCYAFGVQALERHHTVAAIPPACAGLSHEQINQAVGRAINDVVRPLPKAAARQAAYRLRGYLAGLVAAVRPAAAAPVAAAPVAAASGQQSSRLPLDLAALAAWILTTAAGAYLLAGWLAEGSRRLCRARARAARAPAIIVSHVALALAGLALWVAFMVTGLGALAWTGAGATLVIAGLGMASLVTALPEPAASTAPAGRPGLAASVMTPAAIAMPVTVIAVHGIAATATILLVMLAAVGAS